MGISLAVISSMTLEIGETFFSSSTVKAQMQWFFLGWIVFLFFAGLDYQKFSQWSWILYAVVVVLLLGLYFTNPIQSVRRWYRLPFGIGVQPSETAKLIVVMSLAWFLDRKYLTLHSFRSSMQVFIIVGIPFILILKQPDLGTALVLYPIAMIMCYFANVNKTMLKFLSFLGLTGLFIVTLIFSEAVPREKMKKAMTTVMKEYQFERLNPKNYHQDAAQTAISIGGVSGYGWQKGEFSRRKWLPAAHTDSVFAAYVEEFGLIGAAVLLLLYFALIYLSFQIVLVAKDRFGALLASGIAVYFAMHIIVNIAMMCGLLPISGVPLIFLTYGGSTTLTTMAALGILQSIYSRRFMFT